MDKEIYEQIVKKKEFSQLPRKDVELAFSHFADSEYEEDKVKLTRDLLMKVFSAFTSRKLFNAKNKNKEWILKKHVSTRERFDFYEKIYKRILKECDAVSVIDLGAGVNGFSYDYFKKKVNYVGVEAIGQLVELVNFYFKEKKICGKVFHFSLFDLSKVKNLIKKQRGKKVVFLFKTLDSLEMIERDYSKKLLKEIVPLVDKVVVSFATQSLVSRKKFKVQRNWIVNFIKENFEVLDEFEVGGERYISFCKR